MSRQKQNGIIVSRKKQFLQFLQLKKIMPTFFPMYELSRHAKAET